MINSSNFISKIKGLPKPLTVKKLNFTFAFLFAFVFAISAQCVALTIHPSWLQESLDKADKLNDKNPLLALEFTQNLLNQHSNELTPSAKAALFARLAAYQYYLADLDKSLQNIELYYALSPDLTSHDGLSFFIYRQRQTSKILHKLANTDTLTELANRRYTFIYAESMLAQAKKYQQNFAIIIFDIDHFKKINDTYGHPAGDIALKDIALIANEYVRSNDILGQ